MTHQEIESRLLELIETKLHIERHLIRPSARIIDDLGADSLAVMEIIMAMEDEFGIEIRDAEAEKLSTVEDVMRFLGRQLGAAGA